MNSGLGGASGITAAYSLKRADNPSAPSQVQNELLRGDHIIQRLQSVTGALYERLSSVIRKDPEDSCNEKALQPTLVGHAMAIAEHNNILERIHMSLSDILNRIEL